MGDESLSAVLEREHREIDGGFEPFAAGVDDGDVAALRRAIAVLRRHIYVEEERVFPTLREHGLFAPLLVMVREHGQIWDTIDQIERELETDAATVSYRCHQALVQLQHHNGKEERIIYPQADQALTPREAAELVAFLRNGELPAGWVCAKAGLAR